MSARRFDLLVFDWDGTIMDSAGSIVAAIQAACRDMALAEPPPERARYIIGLGLRDALATLLPELDPNAYGPLTERYRHHYLAADESIPLFEGMEELIRGLHERGYLLGVATGKSRRGLDRAFGTTGLGAYFHATRCADEGFSKPHPGMLLEVMDLLCAEPERTLMVGDTTHDLEMARNAGVAAVGVSYGAHPREALDALAPLGVVDSVRELQAWLKQNG